MNLSPEHERYMIDACKDSAPREACGVIAGGVLYQFENHAPDDGAFRILGSDVQAAYDRHGRLDAVWHTHPSGDVAPSARDRASHPWPAALVVATRREVRVYLD